MAVEDPKTRRCTRLLVLVHLSFWCQMTFSEILTTGDLRLVGSSKLTEGRVEIYYNEAWGTICDDNWGIDDATVVCRQLGYDRAISAHGEAYFGEGKGHIWLDDVTCVGYEARLIDCLHKDWRLENCGHNEDAGVACSPRTGSENSVVLVGGSSASEGLVEIFANDQWYTICDDSFSSKEADVICRQLGYLRSVHADAHFGGGGYDQPILASLSCTGYEDRWTECTRTGFGTGLCTHSEEVGIKCSSDTHSDYAAEGAVRLVGGQMASEGRVEVFLERQWKTVCNESWDLDDAKVVCCQLGYEDAVASTSTAGPGPAHMPIALGNVQCSGTENWFSDCESSVYTHHCQHLEDAGVNCLVNDDLFLTPRLANGSVYNEGRVEIWTGHQWEVICSTFSSDTISVLCQQLGHQSTSTIYYSSNKYGGVGNERLSNYTFSCYGHEERIQDCIYGQELYDNPYRACTTVAIRCHDEPIPIANVIGYFMVIILVLVCCGACSCWVCKPKRLVGRPPPHAANNSSLQATVSEPQIHPPPAQSQVHLPPAATSSLEMDTLPSYTDMMAKPDTYPPVGGHHPHQQPYPPHPHPQHPYPQQPHPQQQLYPQQQPHPQTAAYPPQPVQPNPQAAYPPTPNQPFGYNPPQQGDSQPYPHQPPVAPSATQPSVAPHPPQPSVAPYPPQPPVGAYWQHLSPPNNAIAPALADPDMAQPTDPLLH